MFEENMRQVRMMSFIDEFTKISEVKRTLLKDFQKFLESPEAKKILDTLPKGDNIPDKVKYISARKTVDHFAKSKNLKNLDNDFFAKYLMAADKGKPMKGMGKKFVAENEKYIKEVGSDVAKSSRRGGGGGGGSNKKYFIAAGGVGATGAGVAYYKSKQK